MVVFKVMVVDDSMMMRSVIKNYLKKDLPDIEVIEASNGREAIATYKEQTPYITFMDIMMPEIDGLSAAKQIKEFDKGARIVMCTSIKEDAQEKEAADLGVIGYIVKPFRQDEVKEILVKTNMLSNS